MEKNSGEKMKIMYLSSRDAKDKREWSGTLYYMADALSKHAGEVVFAGPYKPRLLIIFLKIINKFSQLILRKRYNIPYSYLLTLAYKYFFTKKIKKEKPDIIVAISASGEMSQLNVNCPIVYVGDITLTLLIDRYPNFTNLSKASIKESEWIEKTTYNNAAALVFSSKWAADSAHEDYGIAVEKSHIISYGANMDFIPEKKEVLSKEINGKLKMLFLGVDWVRKGGDLVYESFLDLQKKGIPVELTVCGCVPPKEYSHPDMKVIPFLNKNNKEDADRLYEILLESNFLFVPSKSDCTPIAFNEANAFGIPVISSDVGGIPSVISNSINGHIFPLDTPKKNFSELISDYYSNPEKYRELVKSSREYYDSNLNWDQWGIKMSQLFNQLLQQN